MASAVPGARRYRPSQDPRRGLLGSWRRERHLQVTNRRWATRSCFRRHHSTDSTPFECSGTTLRTSSRRTPSRPSPSTGDLDRRPRLGHPQPALGRHAQGRADAAVYAQRVTLQSALVDEATSRVGWPTRGAGSLTAPGRARPGRCSRSRGCRPWRVEFPREPMPVADALRARRVEVAPLARRSRPDPRSPVHLPRERWCRRR